MAITDTYTASDIDAFLAGQAARRAQTAEQVAADAADAFDRATAAIGDRKFDIEDVTPALVAAATAYARGYAGTFEYMVDMRLAAGRGLSIPQAKGVLNCMRAQARRDAEQAATAARAAEKGAAPATDPGYYLLDGEVICVVAARSTGRCYGKRFVPGVGSERGCWEYAPGTFQRLTTADTLTMEQAAAWGHLSGRCFKCQARLDDPVSVTLGIGPVCVVKVYGDAGKAQVKATRAAIKAAGRAGAAAA